MENQRQIDPMYATDTNSDALTGSKATDNIVALESIQVNAEEQLYRAGAYRILATLLKSAPDQEVLEQVSGFASIESEGDELVMAMAMLGLSASATQPESIDDEFHELFIGLGRGELMPYGSWYLTGFLMEKPLGKLRDDLAALGYQRKTEVHEPEDHASALCDVMAMLIADGVSHQTQATFFNNHMANWFDRFFDDLSKANAAIFYKAVGRFGVAFTSFEKQYLGMQV